MIKRCFAVLVLGLSIGCGSGDGGSASGSAKASASASGKSGAGDEITEASFVAELEKFFKAMSENAGDCAKMAEALKAVQPNEERKKALDAWEKKAKADPAIKARVDEEVKKLEAKYPLQDAMTKCGEDPAVKAIINDNK